MSDSPAAPPDPHVEMPVEKLRRERRAVALTALQFLGSHAHNGFDASDRHSHEDLNDQHRAVSTLIGEFESELNDLDRVLATERQSPAEALARNERDLKWSRDEIQRLAAQLAEKDAELQRKRDDWREMVWVATRLEADLTAARAEIASQWRPNAEAVGRAYREMLHTLIDAGVPILIPSDSLPPHWQVAVEVLKVINGQRAQIARLTDQAQALRDTLACGDDLVDVVFQARCRMGEIARLAEGCDAQTVRAEAESSLLALQQQMDGAQEEIRMLRWQLGDRNKEVDDLQRQMEELKQGKADGVAWADFLSDWVDYNKGKGSSAVAWEEYQRKLHENPPVRGCACRFCKPEPSPRP